MFLSQEKKLIFSAAVFLTILIILIIPQTNQIQQANRQIFESRQKLELKYEKTKRLHRSQLNLAAAKKTVEETQSLFVKNGEEIKFISSLEDLAEQARVDQKINLLPSAVKFGELNKLYLQIKASGSFSNLMGYLSALENSPFLIAVTNLNYTRSSDQKVILNLKATVYVKN